MPQSARKASLLAIREFLENFKKKELVKKKETILQEVRERVKIAKGETQRILRRGGLKGDAKCFQQIMKCTFLQPPSQEPAIAMPPHFKIEGRACLQNEGLKVSFFQ